VVLGGERRRGAAERLHPLRKPSAPLSVNHQGQFPVVTISFNLAPGASLGAATDAIEKAQKDIGMPLSMQAAFQGTAASFQASLQRADC
jgi:multidrug efflux pump subunit AcrB